MKKEKNHKFKKGQKFTIEIAEAHTHWADGDYPFSLYRIKGFGSLVFDDKGLQRLVDQANEADVSSHSEADILKECIRLMHELVRDFQRWYEWVHGEDAVEELDEEMRFCVNKSYFEIVQQLFLFHTRHSGGGSTISKCNDLGIPDWSDTIEFGFEVENEG